MIGKPKPPSDSELEILQILWEHQPSTVRTIHEVLLQTRGQGAYTTTLKFIQRLTDKGYVSRTKEGKAHVYSAVYTEEQIQSNLFDRFVDSAFKGSAMNMIMHALGNEKASESELNELKEWLAQQSNTDSHE